MRWFDILTCRPEWRTGILTPIDELARAEAQSYIEPYYQGTR
jgi:hypothetical protein